MRPLTWLLLNTIALLVRLLQRWEALMATKSSTDKFHVLVYFTKDPNPETTVEYVDTRYKTARGALNRAIRDFDAYEIEVRPIKDKYYKAEFLI